jgi:hypothetical protein
MGTVGSSVVGAVGGGGLGGSLISGIGGVGALSGASNGSGLPDRTPNGYTQLHQGYNAIDSLIMSYEDLQNNGLITPRIAAGYAGLEPGQSRFGRAVQSYEQSLASADPAFAEYQRTITSGLKGLDSGLPDDVKRSITESLRSAESGRGIDLTSNSAAISEVARLFGGEQAIRSQRLGEASNYFNQVTNQAAQLFTPSLNNYLQASLGSAGLNLQRAEIGQQKHAADQQVGSDVIGGLLGGLLGGGA